MGSKPNGKKPNKTNEQRPRGSGSHPRRPVKRTNKTKGQSGLSHFFGRLSKALSDNASRRRAVILVCICVVAVGTIGAVVYALTNKNAYSIMVGNTQVCFIKQSKQSVKDELEKQAVMKLENEIGSKILVNETVEFKPVHASKKDMVNIDNAILKMADAYTYKVEGYAISVEGTVMAILTSQKEVDTIYEALEEPYQQEGVKETEFVEKVVTSTMYITPEELTTLDKALQILTKTTSSAQSYFIADGDSLSSIAGKASMSIEELLKLNPNYSTDTKLKIGDEILLTIEKPMISVRTIEEKKHIEVEPKTVQNLQNPNQPKSYRKSVQYGSDGQAEVTSHIIRINGIVSETVEVDRNIILQPTAEIIEVGTKQ